MESHGYNISPGNWTCWKCGGFVYDGMEHVCPSLDPVTINIPFDISSTWPPLAPTLEERMANLEEKLNEIIKLLKRIT